MIGNLAKINLLQTSASHRYSSMRWIHGSFSRTRFTMRFTLHAKNKELIKN